MGTELANVVDVAKLQKYDDKAFNSMSSGSFLPRLQLMSAASDLCKKGQFPINHYAFITGQSHVDVGAEVDILVIAWRPKAMKIGGEDVLVSYNPDSDLFRQIQVESNGKDSGCMYGPEFLVYIGSEKKFATLFLGSKSARKEGDNVRARLGKLATMKSQFIEWKSYAWQAPTCIACNTPFDLPSTEEIMAEADKFNNPTEGVEPEKAQTTSGRAR